MEIKQRFSATCDGTQKVNVSPVNVQSLNNKTQDFMDYVIGCRSDLCIITETFLIDLSTVTRSALQPNGYYFIDQPRLSGQARGGTGLLYRDCYKVTKSSYGQKNSFEYSEYLVTWSNKRIKVCIVYHPPPSQSNPVSNGEFLDDFEEYLESVILCDEMLIVAGDFNIHMNKPKDCDQVRLTSILNSCGLMNHVHIPTHKHGNTLDLIITRDNNELALSNPTSGYLISDHCFIHTKLDFPRPNLTVKSINFRNIKAIDLGSFKADLQETVDTLLPLNDIEVLASEYNCRLRDCLDKHAPICEKTVIARPKVPWYNDSLKQQKRQRRKAERKWRKTRVPTDLDLFNQTKNTYSFMLKLAHRNYYESAISEASGNQRKLFSIIQELAFVKKDSPLPECDSLQQLADNFGDFFIKKIEDIRHQIDSKPCTYQPRVNFQPPKCTFSTFKKLSEEEVKRLIFKSKSTSCDLDPIPTPLLKECIDIMLPILTRMVNLSLQSGVFPEEWKLALIIPLIKKLGLELIFNSFRPVSNLPFVSKLVERAAISQENPHIEKNCPLPKFTSARAIEKGTQQSRLYLRYTRTFYITWRTRKSHCWS